MHFRLKLTRNGNNAKHITRINRMHLCGCPANLSEAELEKLVAFFTRFRDITGGMLLKE